MLLDLNNVINACGQCVKRVNNMQKHNIKALLVDDNLVNLKLMIRYLNFLDCEVDTAVNGKDALSKLDASDYDIVFMDCKMPEMDGYEATEKIRSLEGEKSKSLIVAVTANTQPNHKDHCLDVGMNDFVAKPVSKSDIEEVLGKYFGAVN